MKKYGFLICLLIVSVLAAGCNSASGPINNPSDTNGPVFGGQYTYGITGEPTTLNPIFSTDSATSGITNLVYDSLLTIDENLEVASELATDWTISEDNKVLTFNLKQDVKWHDGEKFTAEDVKYTYDVVMHDDYTGVRAKDLKYVEKVEATSEYVVKIYLKQVDAPLMTKLAGSALGILPKHIFENTAVKDLKEHVNSWNPIGTGPYKFVEYKPGQHTILTANTEYYGDGPYIETIMVKTYQDTQVLLAAFENGDVDYIDEIPVNDIEHVKSSLKDTVEFKEGPQNRYNYIGLKQNHPILGDLKVRQALMYALDRDTIINTVFKGYGTVVNSHGVPFSWAYSDDVNKYEQNKDKAISLLEEAGWDKVGSDGIRVNNKGDKLTFVMVSATGNEDISNVISMIDEQWKAIGIDVVVEYYERSVLFSKYLDVGKFEAYMWGWNLGVDPDSYLMFHSDCALDENGVLQGFNDVEYKNDDIDTWLVDGRKTFDIEQRKAIYAKISKKLNEELPYVFLYTNNLVKGMNNKVKNVVWSPLEPIKINKWYIDPAFH
ncbi:hypothetical protein IMX26_12820 [Clostridium sp. 'deep sea']|uniref:ABC transporter substrate-binding protein n=1 Tax=Clostridium sp. 'deep sea' TaxID=2779445 RepID=UPI001896551C|nr:ABC transporter substrate-binding protein [Clostridium sp. 'deep sea']QOR34367.1 hypothetical protein IMX26_12820 [Clostridium sp. 'deep sea']